MDQDQVKGGSLGFYLFMYTSDRLAPERRQSSPIGVRLQRYTHSQPSQRPVATPKYARTKEERLELVHAGIGEEERGVVMGHDGRGGPVHVLALLHEVVDERLPDAPRRPRCGWCGLMCGARWC